MVSLAQPRCVSYKASSCPTPVSCPALLPDNTWEPGAGPFASEHRKSVASLMRDIRGIQGGPRQLKRKNFTGESYCALRNPPEKGD